MHRGPCRKHKLNASEPVLVSTIYRSHGFTVQPSNFIEFKPEVPVASWEQRRPENRPVAAGEGSPAAGEWWGSTRRLVRTCRWPPLASRTPDAAWPREPATAAAASPAAAAAGSAGEGFGRLGSGFSGQGEGPRRPAWRSQRQGPEVAGRGACWAASPGSLAASSKERR